MDITGIEDVENERDETWDDWEAEDGDDTDSQETQCLFCSKKVRISSFLVPVFSREMLQLGMLLNKPLRFSFAGGRVVG